MPEWQRRLWPQLIYFEGLGYVVSATVIVTLIAVTSEQKKLLILEATDVLVDPRGKNP